MDLAKFIHGHLLKIKGDNAMRNANDLYELKLKSKDGFGCELGNGYACFVTRLISGEWMISKLDKNDKDVFRKTIPSNTTEDEFKGVLNEMLNTQ